MINRYLNILILLCATLLLGGVLACDYLPPSDTPTPGAVDADGDGYVSEATGGADCDDADADVHPDAYDDCNGFDTDCDGVTDSDPPAWYIDRDRDSWGDQDEAPVYICDEPGDSYADRGADCNDHNASVSPGGTEKCDDLDNDCNGVADDDSDGDGFDACDDCDPANPDSYPGVDLDGDGYSCDEECVVWDDDYHANLYPGADGNPATCN